MHSPRSKRSPLPTSAALGRPRVGEEVIWQSIEEGIEQRKVECPSPHWSVIVSRRDFWTVALLYLSIPGCSARCRGAALLDTFCHGALLSLLAKRRRSLRAGRFTRGCAPVPRLTRDMCSLGAPSGPHPPPPFSSSRSRAPPEPRPSNSGTAAPPPPACAPRRVTSALNRSQLSTFISVLNRS
jgi:hypothetical protein